MRRATVSASSRATNPQLVQCRARSACGAHGEEMVASDGAGAAAAQVLLSKVDIARAERRACCSWLIARPSTARRRLRSCRRCAARRRTGRAREADLLDRAGGLSLGDAGRCPASPRSLDRLQPAALFDRLLAQGASARGPSHRVGGALGQQRPARAPASARAISPTSPSRATSSRSSCRRATRFGLPADRRCRTRSWSGPAPASRRSAPSSRSARRAAPRAVTGCSSATRSAPRDFFYEDQIVDWQRRGVLHRLDLAFSRDQAEKIYVQHRMRENAAELWAWLAGGRALLCLRRRQAHGQGRRGHARCRSRREHGGKGARRAPRPGSTASPRSRPLSARMST